MSVLEWETSYQGIIGHITLETGGLKIVGYKYIQQQKYPVLLVKSISVTNSKGGEEQSFSGTIELENSLKREIRIYYFTSAVRTVIEHKLPNGGKELSVLSETLFYIPFDSVLYGTEVRSN